MVKAIDETGRRHGRLTVVSLSESKVGGRLMWDCRCDCGGTKTVRGLHLRSVTVRSCGCLQETWRMNILKRYRSNPLDKIDDDII